MFKILKQNKGETIAETIIALAILTIGITLATTMMANSLRNMHSSKNRIIAVNIAREGVEAVRNIRDTNWLKFSGHRRDCWNHLPGEDVDENCDGTNLIEPRTKLNADNPTVFDTVIPDNTKAYIIYLDENNRWRLKNWISIVTGEITFDNADVYLVDIDESNNTDDFEDLDTTEVNDITHDKTNDRDMYNHKPITDNDALGSWTNAHETNFKRIITIDYLNNDGVPLTSDGTLKNEYNRMVVTSIVSWNQGKVRHKVELKTHLTDYYGREKLEH